MIEGRSGGGGDAVWLVEMSAKVSDDDVFPVEWLLLICDLSALKLSSMICLVIVTHNCFSRTKGEALKHYIYLYDKIYKFKTFGDMRKTTSSSSRNVLI